jgi:SulP family sulfate permease
VNGPENREGAREPYASATPFRPAAPDPLLQRAIPVAKELPGYGQPTARRDLLAGVTVAALAIPSAIAYAELAGLPAVRDRAEAPVPTSAGDA